MPAEEAKVVEAERFVLRDTDGRIRAELGAGEAGSIGLKLYDRQSRCRIELFVAKDGVPGMQLWDENEMPRVILALDRDEPYIAAPSLSLTAKGGSAGVLLSVAPDGSPSIDFMKDRKVFLGIPEYGNTPEDDPAGA